MNLDGVPIVSDGACRRGSGPVIGYPHGWSSAYQPLAQENLDLLDALADRLDDLLPRATVEQRDSISGYLTELRSRLTADTSLPVTLRAHMMTLIRNAQECLETFELTGDFDLQTALDRIAAGLNQVFQQSNDQAGWKNVLNGFVYPYAVNTFSALSTTGVLMLIPGAGT